jgi:hypothetical protein
MTHARGIGLFYERVDTVIGFLELLGWAAAIIGLAAAVTYAVIKMFPAREDRPAGDAGS